MRTLTATLASAQRKASQSPAVRVVVRDKQARWSAVGAQGVANAQSALALTAAGVVLAAALDTSGVVHVRRVTDPTLLADGLGWGYYAGDFSSVATDALAWPKGDVAISENSGTLRLFYVKSDGSAILCKESTDGGTTWGAAETVKSMPVTDPNACYKLASGGNDDIFWCYDKVGYRYVYYRKKESGAWGSEKSLAGLTETGGEFGKCGGLTAVWVAGWGKFAVAASFWGTSLEDGYIVTCKFAPVTGALTERQRIVPPGYATTGFTPLWPCLYRTSADLGSRWVLTYTDKFTATRLSWRNPVALLSRDFSHWSYKIPLSFVATYEPRLPLIEGDKVVYAHQVQRVQQLKTWYSGRSDFELAESQARVLRYRISERPGDGSLLVELDNRDGKYDDAGLDSGDAPALRPLAQVIIEQGLNTTAGAERVECRPFLLWSSSRYRAKGANWARLYCVDGWELFRRWRPDATYVFKGKTLRWCIAEIAARVGYFSVSFDSSAEWDSTVSYIALAGERTDWSGRRWVRAAGRWIALGHPAVAFDDKLDGERILLLLLDLVGGAARWGNGDDTDVLYCFIAAKQGASPPAVHAYNNGEVIAGEYVDGFAWPTRVRAVGDAVAYEGQDVANSVDVGMELFSLLYAKNWDTAAKCQIAVESALDDANARAWGGWIETRPNVGLELFDVITLSDARAGGGLTAVKRRVNSIVTEYDPLKRVWRQVVGLEGV